jgi:hypothetical protein
MKKVLPVFGGVILLGLVIWTGISYYTKDLERFPTDHVPVPTISSFNDCLNAGLPIMESYPRQCKTPDGRTFAEELPPTKPTYINATSGVISVTTPTPDSVTGKEFEVHGVARGWYFEGSFPVVVLDKDGKSLVVTPAQAQGDWMTSSPVPFIAKIKVPNTYIGKATILLKKDNPSGLSEHDASMSFPIIIEY